MTELYAPALEALLRECTVQIVDANGSFAGSGFFVAPGQVLTAAHVLAEVSGEVYLVQAAGSRVGPVVVVWMEPRRPSDHGIYPLPDLALISLGQHNIVGHPCVMLGQVPAGIELVAEGYSKGVTAEVSQDTSRLKFETFRPELGGEYIKCFDTVVSVGLSGGPLLDVASGRVVGVMKARRGSGAPVGGVAISVRAIYQRWQEIWQANEDFHRRDRRWRYACTARDATDSSADATIAVLGAVVEKCGVNVALLPKNIKATDVHQQPWVQPLFESQASRTDSSGPETRESWTGSTSSLAGVFKWTSSRCPWRTVTILGLPGYGKTWLLRSHASSLAYTSMQRMQGEEGIFAGVPIPIIADCATFAQLLPAHPDKHSALESLIDAFISYSGCQVAHSQVATVVRVAHSEGLLSICLDGFDEVPSRNKEVLKLAFRTLVDGTNQIILASRPGPHLGSDMTSILNNPFQVRTVGFAPGQVDAFVHAWFRERPDLRDALSAKLLESPELMALARVPLLASFLCLLAQEADSVDALPTSRNILYESVLLGMLAGRWRDSRAKQAFDPENPPDARLRLNSLALALGSITATWRARTDRFTRAALAEALEDLPEYRRLHANALARWRESQEIKRAVPSSPPFDVVVWEYQYDGLLIGDGHQADQPSLRFAHPVLGDFFVAVFLAGLKLENMLRYLDSHRWFDPAWREVFPAVAERTTEAEGMIRWLLSGKASWHEQLLIAGRCIAAAQHGGSPVCIELRSEVVTRIGTLLSSSRKFDRSRATATLVGAARANVPEAQAVLETAAENDNMSADVRLAAITMLAERGNSSGTGLALANLTNYSLPLPKRVGLARSAVVSGAAEAIEQVFQHIQLHEPTETEPDIVEGIPVETSAGVALAIRIFRDSRLSSQARIRAGAVLFRLGNQNAELRSLVMDKLCSLDVRAALLAELLTSGEDDLISVAIEFINNPNVTPVGRIPVLKTLLRRGELAVIDRAREELASRNVAWNDRADIARLLTELGPVGIKTLRDQLSDDYISLEYKLRNLVALINAHQIPEIELSKDLISARNAPAWLLCRLATALILEGVPFGQDEIIAVHDLATSTGERGFQDELLGAMVERNFAGAGEAVVEYLRVGGSNPEVWIDVCSQLIYRGVRGSGVLARICGDSTFLPEGKIIAVTALAMIASRRAGELARDLLGMEMANYMRAGLLIHLAQRGVVEVADVLVGLLGTVGGAYAALFECLSSPRASLDQVTTCVQSAAGYVDVLSRVDSAGSQWPVSSDWLSGLGVEWSSDAEQFYMTKWANSVIEQRASYRLSWLLAPCRFTSDEGEREEQRRALAEELQTEILELEVTRLATEIQSDSRCVPKLQDQQEKLTPLEYLSTLATMLDQWVSRTRAGDINGSVSFLSRNSNFLLTESALVLLDQSASMTRAWPTYEAHRFLVYSGLEQGVDFCIGLLQNSSSLSNMLRELLESSHGRRMTDAAGLGVLTDPDDASHWFYAALGAGLNDNEEFAVRLMLESHKYASTTQRLQGLATVSRIGDREDWPTAMIARLRSALASGVDLGRSSDGGGNGDEATSRSADEDCGQEDGSWNE